MVPRNFNFNSHLVIVSVSIIRLFVRHMDSLRSSTRQDVVSVRSCITCMTQDIAALLVPSTLRSISWQRGFLERFVIKQLTKYFCYFSIHVQRWTAETEQKLFQAGYHLDGFHKRKILLNPLVPNLDKNLHSSMKKIRRESKSAASLMTKMLPRMALETEKHKWISSKCSRSNSYKLI